MNADFFQLPTIELSKQLLGKELVHVSSDGITSGIITETEAYLGVIDKAAHAYGGRRTKRTEVLYGLSGKVYTYTMHTVWLLNVVSSEINVPECVLIRALEPLEGIHLMARRRNVILSNPPTFAQLRNLTVGPGRLCKAMKITGEQYGWDLIESPLFIREGIQVENIDCGPRVGIPNAEDDKDKPYRFWIKGNNFSPK